ncbi:MAG: 2-oxo acid dehydrogenase subunit E2 [Candidatus Helarchaeota archaeon]
MITKLVLPKLGWTMESGKIVEYLKKEGDPIKKREPIVMIETDKVTLEVESPIDGYLRKIVVPEGQTVPVGTLIAVLADTLEEPIPEDLEEISIPSIQTGKKEEKVEAGSVLESEIKTPAKGIRIFASPRARKLAREKNVDLSNIVGTGPNGRIIERDIINYLNSRKERKIEAKTIPLEGIRKIIADKMSFSLSNIPQLTYTSEVDMSEAIRVRKYLLEQYSSEGIKITLTDIIIKAVIETIKKYPIFNSMLKDDKIIINDEINIGVAVATDRGLIVPVIHKANNKSIKEISNSVRDLANRARANKLNLDDVTGGTFTVSNLGMFGIEIFTPIINPPESAILGIGKVIEKTIVKDGQIQIAPMMQLSLTHDHRIMDGVDAAKFLQEAKRLLENPYELLNLRKEDILTTTPYDKKLIKIQNSDKASKIDLSKDTKSKTPSDKAAMKFVDMLRIRGKSILGHDPKQMGLIGGHNPHLLADFARMHRDAMHEGALSTKIKALIALAIAVIVGCESCMKWHLVEAIEAGATDEEISEALGVTIYMGGGPALMHAETVAEKLDELRL